MGCGNDKMTKVIFKKKKRSRACKKNKHKSKIFNSFTENKSNFFSQILDDIQNIILEDLLSKQNFVLYLIREKVTVQRIFQSH